jgi:hypothetical protein
MTKRTLLISIPLVCLLSACRSPDPEERYDAFASRTSDMRAGEATILEGVDIDFSGRFVLAAATVLSPGLPLVFQVEVTITPGDPATIEFVFQPLTTVTDETGEPRAEEDQRVPTGDEIIVTGVEFIDGAFSVDMGTVNIPGAANPLTFRDVVAELVLTGAVLSETEFCGGADGAVIEPIVANLDGSTFGALGVDDVRSIPADELLTACPEEEGDGGSDAGGS